MKKTLFALGIIAITLAACTKSVDQPKEPKNPEPAPVVKTFTKYVIPKGQQTSTNNTSAVVNYDELKFVVKFDSSAIYNLYSDKQFDINKLYGFSDNNASHHVNSARFGWRWSDNALRLFAYIYNNGVRTSRELGTATIGSEINCTIKVAGNEYIFTINGNSVTMPRSSTTPKGSGYKLYPYFGGTEVAPHNITIEIKE